MTERLLVIGGGLAGTRLATEVARQAPGRHAITLLDGASEPGCDRTAMTTMLAGATATRFDPAQADLAATSGITFMAGTTVLRLCSQSRRVLLADGRELGFDRCVLATGSQPARLPISGIGLAGVVHFDRAGDIACMAEAADRGARIAVVGGSLLGVETAHALAGRGARVTLVQVLDQLMERHLDARAAALLRQASEHRGITVLLDRQTRRITGHRRATGLAFADGSSLSADLVVMTVGTVPETRLAAAAGIGVNRGILVDDRLETTLPGIHAIGDCAEHRGTVSGLAEAAIAQADCLASRLCGQDVPFTGLVPAIRLKVSGLPVFSAGDVESLPGTECITYEDAALGQYRKLVLRSGRLVGALLYGDVGDADWYRGLILTGTDVTSVRSDLIFGEAFAATPAGSRTLLKAA